MKPPINEPPVSNEPIPWWDDAVARCDPSTHEDPGDGHNFPCWSCRDAAVAAHEGYTP